MHTHALFTISGDARTQTNGFYTYYLKSDLITTIKPNSLEYKLEKLFAFIQAVRDKSSKNNSQVTLDKVTANIDSLNYFKDGINDYLNYYDNENNNSTEGIIDDYDDETDRNGTNKNYDGRENTAFEENVEEINKTLLIDNDTKVIEDQIAEESDLNVKVKIDDFNIEIQEALVKEDANIKTRTKREADLNYKNKESAELTVVSGNLTLNKAEEINNSNIVNNNTYAAKTNVEKEDLTEQNDKVTEPTDTHRTNIYTHRTPTNADEFDISLDDSDEETETTTEVNKNKPRPFKFDLFRRRPVLRQLIKMIPRINKKGKSKFNLRKNRVSEKFESKFNPINKFKKNILKRHKRFLPFFQRSEDSNNILFRMLDFLIKNRKNVLPVFTVMREINTLVKSANGELNHISKESNNYIGATPPAFTPITYSLELGNENRVMAFVKKLFGVIPKGDRLTIAGGKK